jgi:iron complex transport system ATP-binding protein
VSAPATARDGAALELDRVQAVRRGRPLSEPISLRCPPGTVLGVVGPNGAGKSSLLGAVAHTGVAATGAVRYAGVELRRLDARHRARTVALLAQDNRAPDELLARDVVRVGARAGRPDAGGVEEACDAALAATGVPELSGRRFGTLSGGERQLVQLARVLAQDTPVVVLDEPTSALDLAHQRAVEDAVRGLAGRGRIVLVALHDLSLALNACTRVLLLGSDGGWREGEPRDVLHPKNVHAVYGVRTTVHTTPGGRAFLAPTDPEPLEDQR